MNYVYSYSQIISQFENFCLSFAFRSETICYYVSIGDATKDKKFRTHINAKTSIFHPHKLMKQLQQQINQKVNNSKFISMNETATNLKTFSKKLID